MIEFYKIINIKINNVFLNNTGFANSSDKIFKNFINDINSTAQYYLRKYGMIYFF